MIKIIPANEANLAKVYVHRKKRHVELEDGGVVQVSDVLDNHVGIELFTLLSFEAYSRFGFAITVEAAKELSYLLQEVVAEHERDTRNESAYSHERHEVG